MEIARYALIVYGVLMILGGILGYVLPKTPSKVSLIAGGTSGLLAIVASFISRGEDPLHGLAIGLVISAGVALMMLPRLKKAKKPMSTGMIIVLSAATAVIVILGLISLP